ncbi:MAG: tryptophan synthase subunit alpha [Nitrospiria bacterium]
MSRIEATLKNVAVTGGRSLIVYVMAGDPSLEETGRIVLAIEKAGADVIELGVPFSDPIADGPTIQRASERALRQGVTLRKVLDLVTGLRRQTKIPLILMSYCNPIFVFGIEAFFKEARKAGVNGVIIPDLPPEEARDFLKFARRSLIDTIFLIAPTTTSIRAEKILKVCSGFVYDVPLTGVTGSKLSGIDEIKARISDLKSKTNLPVAVGFGISTPAEAEALAETADGIIVGSALVRIIEGALEDTDYLKRLANLVGSLKEAICVSGDRVES